MSGIEVKDAGDLRKYRTEVPNLIFELGLSPYALALYMHFKRTAGDDGKCWKSTRRLAEETKISAGKVSQARKELEERDLITVEYPENNNEAITVTIVDIWPENFDHFRKARMTRSSGERPVHDVNATRSSGERRKEPLEEGSSKESNDSLSGEAHGKAATPSPTKEIPSGQYGVSFLMDRLKEAKQAGAKPPPLTNRQRGEYGEFFAQAVKDGESVADSEMVLRWLVAKACGEVENEPEAWAYFGSGQRAVRDGWRPKRHLKAVSDPETEARRARDWAEIDRMNAELLKDFA